MIRCSMAGIGFSKSLLLLLSITLIMGSEACNATVTPPVLPPPSAQNPSGPPGTATPTFLPITPEPTPTPLFRSREILPNDYGQHLTLWVGDSFLLFRDPSDTNPLDIDNPRVLQISGNPQAAAVTLVAAATGEARVTETIVYPCPNAPFGCPPPMNRLILWVTIADH